jgi:hypothetical protein
MAQENVEIVRRLIDAWSAHDRERINRNDALKAAGLLE